MGESTKLCYESWLVEPAGPSQLDQTTELLDGFSDSQQLGQYMLAGSQSSCAESNIFQANIGPPSGYERASNSWSLLDSYRVTTSGQSIVSPADTILSPSCRPESLQDCPMMLPDCQNDSSTISSDCHHQSILMNGMRPTDESAEIREIHTASGNVNTIATRKPVRLTRTRKPPVDQFPRRGRVAKASRRSRIGQREEIQDCITVSTDATAATDDTKISEASAAALNASSPVTMTTMSDEASIMSLEEHVISPVQPERPHLSHPPEVTKEAAIFSSISDDAHSSSDLLSGIVEAMSRQWSPLNESSAARTGQAEDQSTPAAQAGTNAAATHSRTLNSTCDVTPTMTGAFRVRLMAVFEADASVLCVSASDAFSFNRSVRPGYEGLSWNETATIAQLEGKTPDYCSLELEFATTDPDAQRPSDRTIPRLSPDSCRRTAKAKEVVRLGLSSLDWSSSDVMDNMRIVAQRSAAYLSVLNNLYGLLQDIALSGTRSTLEQSVDVLRRFSSAASISMADFERMMAEFKRMIQILVEVEKALPIVKFFIDAMNSGRAHLAETAKQQVDILTRSIQEVELALDHLQPLADKK